MCECVCGRGVDVHERVLTVHSCSLAKTKYENISINSDGENS